VGWRAARLTVTEKDVRYTVTITEYDGDGYDTDAKVMRSTPHTGEAVEIFAAAVGQENNPAEPVINIYRGSQGVKVDLAELVEAARVGATTPQGRRLWVDAMVTLIRGWVYPLGRRPSDAPTTGAVLAASRPLVGETGHDPTTR
jgi:hypothetical protein